jgi:hypothetical protein
VDLGEITGKEHAEKKALVGFEYETVPQKEMF